MITPVMVRSFTVEEELEEDNYGLKPVPEMEEPAPTRTDEAVLKDDLTIKDVDL